MDNPDHGVGRSPCMSRRCGSDVTAWTAGRPLIDLLSGRWTLPVLSLLGAGARRYQDLDDALPGVSHKVLTETLRRAERDGLLARQIDRRRVGTATLYQLTPLGRSLQIPLACLQRWVEENWHDVETARRHWSRRRA
jgi:DNA-binding HxlR family transcriptional regulator